MTSDKKSIPRLVEICFQKGIRDVVFSPGSRNAPLVIAFNADGRFNLSVVADERVAAFFAMGKSIATQNPAIICCTSGTAALNYAPAIAEAYYQFVPLLVLTADRPVEKIDQGIGQSIRQKNVFQNYIKASYQLIQEASEVADLKANDKIVDEAIDTSLKKDKGPVHINIPFHEPLYGLAEADLSEIKFTQVAHADALSQTLGQQFLDTWANSERKMIIAGLMPKDDKIIAQLKQLSQDENIMLLSESCSNVHNENGVACIDRVLTEYMDAPENFKPDLIVSIGGPIISKKIKQFLQKHKAKQHWCVNQSNAQDTFEQLSHHFKIDTAHFLQLLLDNPSLNNFDYQKHIQSTSQKLSEKHHQFLNTCAYSDLKVFDYLLKHIPADTHLHLSNSTVVRYVQLFDRRNDLVYYANRGVSGIDGSTSTALGVASKEQGNHILITGDIAFFYDSNAFWHDHIPNNIKIILINNEGGGIFRIIDGPSGTPYRDQFFEATHKTNAFHLSMMFDLEYQNVASMDDLNSVFNTFIQSNVGKAQILEILTPRENNDAILNDYFQSLKV